MAIPRTSSTATTAMAAAAPTQPKDPDIDETGEPRNVLEAEEGAGVAPLGEETGDAGAGRAEGAGALGGVLVAPEVLAEEPEELDVASDPAESPSDPSVAEPDVLPVVDEVLRDPLEMPLSELP